MKVLLDTHIFLWWIADDPQLLPRARKIVRDGRNRLFLSHVYRLPNHHRDPFDRLIIAQAKLENLPIVTADSQIAQYPVRVIW